MNRMALAAAKRGAEYLDKRLGRGWRRKIRRRKLDLVDGCNCIIGQLNNGNYEPCVFGVEKISDERRLGFYIGFATCFNYEDLTEAWLAVLREKV